MSFVNSLEERLRTGVVARTLRVGRIESYCLLLVYVTKFVRTARIVTVRESTINLQGSIAVLIQCVNLRI